MIDSSSSGMKSSVIPDQEQSLESLTYFSALLLINNGTCEAGKQTFLLYDLLPVAVDMLSVNRRSTKTDVSRTDHRQLEISVSFPPHQADIILLFTCDLVQINTDNQAPDR